MVDTFLCFFIAVGLCHHMFMVSFTQNGWYFLCQASGYDDICITGWLESIDDSK